MKRGGNSTPARPGKGERFYTIADVAELLAVSKRTVSRWIAIGELRAHRFGRAVRISDTDLRALLGTHGDSRLFRH
jgi:excisionase family DNA binding protein